MTLFDLILIAVSLSMDAFAVSICKGLSVRKVSLQHAMICGVWFGAAVLLPERAADETQLEAYYAALYESDGYFTYGVAADDVLPLDGYGFYEVS